MKTNEKNINRYKLIFVLSVLLVVFGCTFINETIHGSPFAIYFLKNDTLRISDVYFEDIDSLDITTLPWLNSKDIEFYDGSSHCVYLKNDKKLLLQNFEIDSIYQFPIDWSNKPFVIVSRNTRYCIGYFSNINSSMWPAPSIPDFDNKIMYPSDVLIIDWPWLYYDNPMDNELLKENLIESNLFRGGVEVFLDTADAIISIDNADTATITYTMTFKNNDKNDLYILDPDKTGSEIFHHYNNGPVFKNLETGRIYESSWKITNNDPWIYDWYTKLESGMTIKRSITLRGYPYFPPGEYVFELSYCGITKDMEKNVRELGDGRIWLGPTRSNTLLIEWENIETPKVNLRYFSHNKYPDIIIEDWYMR